MQLYVPQRGDTAKLVNMAYTNAVERLARESGRTDRQQRLLDETAAVLGLAEPPKVIESYRYFQLGDGTSVPWWCLRTAAQKRAATGGLR